MPERLHLPDAWTPKEFLASVARLKGVGTDEALLSRVGLAGAVDRKIGGFSKGMRQRLGLAVALLGKPELLILDEPTDGIDPLGRVEVRRILLEEKARGATVLLNSHLLAETERVCDRVGILHLGMLVREGTLESLTAQREGWFVKFSKDPGPISGFTASGDGFVFDSPDAEFLNVGLGKARDAGALVLEVRPRAFDLEDVLAEATR